MEVAEDTFEALYRQRYRDVFRYALMMLRRSEDAEDVAGETFHRAYVAWNSGHGPSGQALPWLLLIARRLVIDKARRRRLISWFPLGGVDQGRRFARELPARQREVLILRYQRDMDDQAIGEILGLSASGVRSLVARACATLRRNPEIWR
jgi:DNA-directed RNA polymerase specialized sigma24 family protein